MNERQSKLLSNLLSKVNEFSEEDKRVVFVNLIYKLSDFLRFQHFELRFKKEEHYCINCKAPTVHTVETDDSFVCIECETLKEY